MNEKEETLRKALAGAEAELAEYEVMVKYLGEFEIKRWTARTLVMSLKNSLGIPLPSMTLTVDTAKGEEKAK